MQAADSTLIYSNEHFTLMSDKLIQGESTVWIENSNLLCIHHKGVNKCVPVAHTPAHCPGYKGSMTVLSLMYNLAIQELEADLNHEGLMTAGVNWDGVWTRDTAYAAMLGAITALPQACKASLESRVKDARILQDTGTGGSWPISTDRVVWAEAAWLYYSQTGDQEFLVWAAEIIENTLRQDEEVLQREGLLFVGETSFIDWREQSYPDWMEPTDIGASYSLSTNVMHAVAYQVLSLMLRDLQRKEEAEVWAEKSKELKEGIRQKFWNTATQQFGMVYTQDGYLDERIDSLACALSVLSGVAGEKSTQVLAHLPSSNYGVATFGPYKSTQSTSYHNRSVWPFVEAFVLFAQAEQRDIEGAHRSMAYLLRSALLFGSNKENLNALTGEADDTIQNSDGQLWSAAGMLGLFYYVLFGLRIENNNLIFTPCVPRAFEGSHWLTGIRIRDMVLDIHINGYGTEISAVSINGHIDIPMIPLDRQGRLLIELELQPQEEEEEEEALTTPAPLPPIMSEDLPEAQWAEDCSSAQLHWLEVEGATAYRVYHKGKAIAQTASCTFTPPASEFCEYYRIQALNEDNSSYLNKPFPCLPISGAQAIYSTQALRVGEEGEYPVKNAQAWLDSRPCTAKLFYEDVHLPAGRYAIQFSYCNASASLRDGDSCALRALYINEQLLGYLPLPHNTEEGQWEDFTFTAPVKFLLEEEGDYSISLRHTAACDKGTLNQCMLKDCRIIALSPLPTPPELQETPELPPAQD